MPAERKGDLLGGQHQPARRVQDQIDRHICRREFDRSQDLLRVLDVDVASDRQPQEAKDLLPVDQSDHAGAAQPLDVVQEALPRCLDHLLP